MFSFLGTAWGFGSITIIALLMAFIIWRGTSIVIGKWVSINETKKKKVSPHSTCPYSKDIMDVIHRTAELHEKRQELKASIIEAQMRYFEEIEEEVQGDLKHAFIHLLEGRLDATTPIIGHGDYAHYVLVLRIISGEIKSYIRGLFRTNHYATYSIETQREYIDRKRSLIIQKITEAFNIYWRGTVVTRTDIYKKHKEHITEYENAIENIFNRAFYISRDVGASITALETSYSAYIESIVGVCGS